ncbi:hypothetical protein MUN78_04445 [Leucobacter allii]|uniref:Uncharacterized protein n=1 Tax=Leucobacter allii TaxID=2932247 RepID=A0ABY4FPE0_9MICO|nr:hypothetical protein [Leucobacter allii]UOQ58101.1 hypothetical protein MUN78_04445 [Leucobacter allii]
MTRYRHPAGAPGRVVLGGVAFIDGVSADIDPGPATRQLFEATGVTPIPADPAAEEPAPADDTEKPARSRRK